MNLQNYCVVKVPLTTTRRVVKRIGATYLNFTKLANGHLDDNQHVAEEKLNEDGGEEFNVDIDFLKSLDPKEWKEQDHYQVLGLQHLRFDATDDDVRRAYRRMVLQHHPDKRKAKGEEVNQDTDYFTCITKAYEMLGTTKTRRAYDSVDPEFDDGLPTTQEIEKNYYGIFNKYFNLNARWSERQPVPPFGDEHAQRQDVDRFYNFWYDFKSWREFSYLDEEDKEKGQDRDERRWIEKENKAARIKRKKEEMQRIRALVDLAYNNDKRIDKFKEEEKQRKLAAKRAKLNAAQALRVEQERAARELQLERERAEKAEQKRIENIRIEREQMKRALKKERKILRDRAKESKYFSSNDKEFLRNMEAIERLCENLTLNELQELNREFQMKGAKEHDIFHKSVQIVDDKLQQQKNQQQQCNGINNVNTNKTTTTTTTTRKENDENNENIKQQQQQQQKQPIIKEVNKKEIWTNDNVQLLIKAVNLFPAGTAQRWDVVSAFINQHATNGVQLTARDVLNKAKALQQSDFSKSALKKQVNETAFQSFEKKSKKLDVTPNGDISYNNDNVQQQQHLHSQQNGTSQQNDCDTKTTTTTTTTTTKCNNNGLSNGVLVTKDNNNGTTTTTTSNEKLDEKNVAGQAGASTWTMEEQALLEQAIKTYPISTPDRWDCIAACIPNRSKKDCLRRVKELVGIVNAKKEAQTAVK